MGTKRKSFALLIADALFLATIFLFLPLFPVFAFRFDPNFIISDYDAINIDDMSRMEIQKFLKEKQSRLTYYETLTKEGKFKMASTIINEAAHEFGISKRFLLVLLQREQSLITDPTPKQDQLDWATGYALCDTCSKTAPELQRWKGFAQQVRSAAAQFRDYFDNPGSYKYRLAETYRIDEQKITPRNQATLNLYIYTPHLQGNKNFAVVWNQWFGDGTDLEEKQPTLPYPDGTLLKLNDEDIVWYIHKGQRKEVVSRSVLESRFNVDAIITASKEDLEKYPLASAIKFHQYAIVRDEDEEVYLIINEEKRRFDSKETLRKIGYNPEEILDVKHEELASYDDGLPITQYSTYPTGTLLKRQEDNSIFYVESGVKYPIVDPQILKINFPRREIGLATEGELNQYMTGNPYPIHDGELIKTLSSPSVYVISNGRRHPIPSEAVFHRLGYQWPRILIVSEAVLQIHPLSDPLTGE